MAFRSVVIEALASALPPHRVTSTSIEAELAGTYARLGVPQGTIEMLVGVKARRFWDDGATIDVLAADVVRRALAGRPELKSRVGLCVSTSVCKDYVEPSVAALVSGALEFPSECQTFDVGNACLGFMTGIELAARQIELREIDVAVVCAAESSRHVVRATIERLAQPTSTMQDYKEALPTLTLGSAAVAMVLVHESIASPASSGHRVNDIVTRADPGSSRVCLGTADWMKTDATVLLKNGVELAARTWAAAQQKFGWTSSSLTNIDQFLCHQVGATHLATLFKKLDLPVDKAFLTYPELGNTGPAAVPMALALAVDNVVVKRGHRLALMGIGSGLNVSMMDVTW